MGAVTVGTEHAPLFYQHGIHRKEASSTLFEMNALLKQNFILLFTCPKTVFAHDRIGRSLLCTTLSLFCVLLVLSEEITSMYINCAIVIKDSLRRYRKTRFNTINN